MEAEILSQILIVAAVFTVAVLYSSVGHAGASGYLAVMALLSVAPNVTRPAALVLNIFVAAIAAFQFYRAGFFDWRVFASFAASSVPFAFVGGMIVLPTNVHKIVLGGVLLIAALRLAWNFTAEKQFVTPTVWLALILGAAMGLLSGLTGVGGGIFLTPVLLLTNWTETKKAAGISAMFILVNSISGLLGNYAQIGNLSSGVWAWVAAAALGGFIGSTLGSRRFNSITLRRVLSLVLVIAGLKLIFT
ncbi:MAG: sulfite exporter TauE/SafE family protein [Acidobacteriota bacterium]|nr:sulfite exporter TauE/SafE family protein [Acidobacteriota bacterium]